MNFLDDFSLCKAFPNYYAGVLCTTKKDFRKQKRYYESIAISYDVIIIISSKEIRIFFANGSTLVISYYNNSTRGHRYNCITYSDTINKSELLPLLVEYNGMKPVLLEFK